MLLARAKVVNGCLRQNG